jgi:hypothetical protein
MDNGNAGGSADYHARCGSWVRLEEPELTECAAIVTTHPVSSVHKGECYVCCDLAVDHHGLCEAFVDTFNRDGSPISLWLRWEHAPARSAPQTRHQRVESREPDCQARSANGWYCTRPADHDPGHVFVVDPR